MAERKRLSVDEKVKEIENKIDYHKKCIKNLESQKDRILNPKPRKVRIGIKLVLDKAKETGLSPKDIAEKLGIEL